MTEPHPLDDATALQGVPAAATRIGRTSDAYWTFIGNFCAPIADARRQDGAFAGLCLPELHAPPASARSLLWLRDATPRPLDFVSLLAMSDAFFGRIFRVVGRITPFGTVSMTTHFHAAADELAAHGSAPIACSVDARIFNRSDCDQTAELYGAGGALLATATQIAYFKL